MYDQISKENEIKLNIDINEKDVEMIGSCIANADEKIQARFFYGMISELLYWRTEHNIEMQSCSVRNELESIIESSTHSKKHINRVMKLWFEMLLFEEK